MSSRPSRVAFVGNIPYGVPEEQLVDIFSEVGPVISFRLVFDRETGKPKGYGFCEYHDVETAMCAVRNLNNYEINGRQLRVAFAENEISDQRERSERLEHSHHHSRESGFSSSSNTSKDFSYKSSSRHESSTSSANHQPVQQIPSLETINTTLASMSSNQLLEVLTHMKTLIGNHPEEARQILNANPQLSYALFQALLMMGLVDANLALKLTQNFQSQNVASASAQQPIPSHILKGLEEISPEQRNLLLQILQMTPEQINALPLDQKQHILTIKNQLLSGSQ